MGTIKVAILEKDGVDYDSPVEMDLKSAVSYVGSDLIPELTSDPVSPVAGQSWVLKTVVNTPMGLLLSLTVPEDRFSLSYKTIGGRIVRTQLT